MSCLIRRNMPGLQIGPGHSRQKCVLQQQPDPVTRYHTTWQLGDRCCYNLDSCKLTSHDVLLHAVVCAWVSNAAVLLHHRASAQAEAGLNTIKIDNTHCHIEGAGQLCTAAAAAAQS
jgi:hypothetical protein